MIRNHSTNVWNWVKRSGVSNYHGLNRLWNHNDLKGLCSVSLEQKIPQLLRSDPWLFPANRLFCKMKIIRCWQCGSELHEDLFINCNNCLAPQLNGRELNYFTVFDQEIKYDVNVAEIRQKYLSLQKILHPDKFANRSQKDQEKSADLSTFVNKAYKVLKNPYERGIYLLKLQGVYRDESDGNYIMDPDFLEDMLTINETILESDSEALQKIRSDVENKVNYLVDKISKGFHSNSLQQVELLLNKLKFYVNILDKITEKE